jgi:hypothetical protein
VCAQCLILVVLKCSSHNLVCILYSVDPENNPTPPEYKDMAVQPLGDRQSIYKEYVQGCIDKYQPTQKHKRCVNNERERVEMSLRQPQSMVVRTPILVLELVCALVDLVRNSPLPCTHKPANMSSRRRSRITQSMDSQRFVRQTVSFGSSRSFGTSTETSPSLRTGRLETPIRTTG